MSDVQIHINGWTGIPLLLLLVLTLVCTLMNSVILILVFMEDMNPSLLSESPTSEFSSEPAESAGDPFSSAFSSTVKESVDKFMARGN